MTSRFRSASVGAAPIEKPLARSRAESSGSGALEVRCGCQYFQSDSLLPDRINPIGSRPTSRMEYYTEQKINPPAAVKRATPPPTFSFGPSNSVKIPRGTMIGLTQNPSVEQQISKTQPKNTFEPIKIAPTNNFEPVKTLPKNSFEPIKTVPLTAFEPSTTVPINNFEPVKTVPAITVESIKNVPTNVFEPIKTAEPPNSVPPNTFEPIKMVPKEPIKNAPTNTLEPIKSVQLTKSAPPKEPIKMTFTKTIEPIIKTAPTVEPEMEKFQPSIFQEQYEIKKINPFTTRSNSSANISVAINYDRNPIKIDPDNRMSPIVFNNGNRFDQIKLMYDNR